MTCFERVVSACGRIRDHVATLVNSSEVTRLKTELSASLLEKERMTTSVESLAEELAPRVPEAPPEEGDQAEEVPAEVPAE